MNEQQEYAKSSGRRRGARLVLPVLSTLLAGFQPACTTNEPAGRAFENALQHSAAPVRHPGRPVRPSGNPVIFVHGTMGSRIVEHETGRVVWGEFAEGAANDYEPEAIRGLALPMGRGRSLAALQDGTGPASIMNHVGLTLLPGLRLDIGYYAGAMERFDDAVNGASPEVRVARAIACDRCLEFSYDWRRSCDENAVQLARFIQAKKAEFVHRHGYPEDMKFDLIAHSLGTLVLRYYLRYGHQPLPRDGSRPVLTWAGASNVENVALLGPPNAGIPLTLQHLTHGHRVQPLFPRYEAAVVGTMPSIYQVLPRARDGALRDPVTKTVLDPLDFDLWVRKGWGLADPGQDEALQVLLPQVERASERRAIALDHLRKCLATAARFQSALDRPARKPRHLRIATFAGDATKTPVSYLATPRKAELFQQGKGDGVIPLASALHCPSSGPKGSPGTAAPFQWDETHVFDCTHSGVACKKKVNQHVIALLVTGQ